MTIIGDAFVCSRCGTIFLTKPTCKSHEAYCLKVGEMMDDVAKFTEHLNSEELDDLEREIHFRQKQEAAK